MKKKNYIPDNHHDYDDEQCALIDMSHAYDKEKHVEALSIKN